jgi:hypothetical protein
MNGEAMEKNTLRHRESPDCLANAVHVAWRCLARVTWAMKRVVVMVVLPGVSAHV